MRKREKNTNEIKTTRGSEMRNMTKGRQEKRNAEQKSAAATKE